MSEINAPMSESAIRHLIEERAYQLWESHGRPQGYEQIHWQQAEQEIMSCIEQRTQHPKPGLAEHDETKGHSPDN